MTTFQIAYFSATGMESGPLNQALSVFTRDYCDITLIAKTSNQLFDDSRIEAFVNDCITSDIVIISLHGGRTTCPAFEEIIKAFAWLKENHKITPVLHVQPTSGDEDSLSAALEHSTLYGDKVWSEINRYLNHGGYINYLNLLKCLKSEIGKDNIDYDKPVIPPNEGLYHPDIKGIPQISDYLAEKYDREKVTVGLWFAQNYWLNNNLEWIDGIIREVEKNGANVIPVFHLRFPDKEKRNLGADEVAKKFFCQDGKPIIDVIINPMMFSLRMIKSEYTKILPSLNVPVIQAIMSLNPKEVWKASVQGLSSMEVSLSAAQPEFDGVLISVPVASKEEDKIDPLTGILLTKYMPIKDRAEKVVSLSLNWGKLSKKINSERKIAVIFHHYPPRNDRIGCTAGLDSFESVNSLLKSMKRKNYKIDTIYEDGTHLSKELLSRMTCDQRWLMPEDMDKKSEASADSSDYIPWRDDLPEKIRNKQKNDWGEAPGDLFVHEGKMYFAGLVNGNVFITIQPPRGYLENIEKLYHDMHLSPPHHYLYQYRWIKDVFKADAVVHVGKHGSLEWLPGKALGLSEDCYPDAAIMDLPNIYPYIINDPGEGTQAKRRSFCAIIDHLPPASTNSDLYEGILKVSDLLKQYSDAKMQDQPKVPVLKKMIWEEVTLANLDKDLEIVESVAFVNFEGFIEKLHAYLSEIEDTMINDGLHILGEAPSGKRLDEYIVQLTRIANGATPSLRETISGSMGYNYDQLLEMRGKELPNSRETGGDAIRKVHEKCLKLVKSVSKNEFNPVEVEHLQDGIGKKNQLGAKEVIRYICEELVPNIRMCTDEINNSLKAFEGKFVPPGPSGALSRGQADILPTGRNFYSVDPEKIPTRAAWKIGKSMGDALINRYLEDSDKYPESIGIIVYGSPTMRTSGDDIAEIFYLLGVKPVWQKGSEKVTGLEVIPTSELGRPRLDVVPRVSGFFRDSFPNLMERIDEAVKMVAALNEPYEINILRSNVISDLQNYKEQGMNDEEAMRNATFRVFGCPPGSYGAGVAELVESKKWETQDDLAKSYIRFSSHAYGEGSYGEQKPQVFKKLLSRMDVTVKNEDSREYDMMSCTDYYNYYGGLIVSANTVRGKAPFSVMGDSSDPKRVKMRTTQEEAKHILRSRLVNPKWIDGMKRHGYKGAGEISHAMDIIFGWDATAEVIDDWMYEAVAGKYALDKKMQDWMKEVNPFALSNIIDKLLEADARGMWNAEAETLSELRKSYLEIEGEIEEATE
jgi:cobaltochelatase CobN